MLSYNINGNQRPNTLPEIDLVATLGQQNVLVPQSPSYDVAHFTLPSLDGSFRYPALDTAIQLSTASFQPQR